MLAPARWYFDADTIGPGKVLSRVRTDVTWPGDDGERDGSARWWLPASPVAGTDVDDDVWIPAVAAAGMTIVSRDRHIASRLRERAAIQSSSARMFAITTAGPPLTAWELVEVIVTRWRDMEASVATQPGPFIYTLTRAGRMKDLLA